jgi:MtN3 and saliva related transmembrane protein
MTMSTVNVIGSIAAILTTASWLPQLVRSWRTRSVSDISWTYLAMFSTGVALWMTYGILREDLVITIPNLITLLLVIAIMIVKFIETRR